MSKKLLYLIFLFGIQFLFAQQNDEFKMVKEYYDVQRSRLVDVFKNEIQKQHNIPTLNSMEKDFTEFMVKLDSIQNVALLSALIKVKNREDLAFISNQKKVNPILSISEKPSITEIPAEYPGGMNELRKQVSQFFYFDALLPDVSKLSTDIHFIVEKDGTISAVRANGDHFVFNRQAEIAVYLLPEKFTPAILNGEKVRYRFRVPLTMNFE